MAHLAFDDIEGVEVSDLEIIRPGATYTVDTVRELVSASWSVELLVGADAASGLDTWHQANDLATLVTVGIFPREGTTPQLSPMWRYELLAMEPVDLSSTQIRDLEAQGRDISGLLPPGVISLWHQLQG
jgi:nicotinate-nucleotide adenylyltransferase